MPPTRTFQVYVGSHGVATPQLPLVHITDGFSFREIIQTRRLETTACSVFAGEDLLYFFYGRAAYRKHLGKLVKTEANAPIAIAVNSPGPSRVKRVFPFDSGGCAAKMYDAILGPHDNLTRYVLPATIESAQRTVTAFYDDNGRYLHGKAKTGLSFLSTEFELRSYLDLISTVTTDYDDRARSIEIQCDSGLSIERKTILGFVVPEEFRDWDEFNALLEDTNARVEYYFFERAVRTEEYMMLIRDRVSRLLTQ